MNGSVKKIMSLILLISCANSNALIYLAIKYVKTFDNGRTQTLWLLADLHSQDPSNDLQVKAMLSFAQQLKNSGYTVKFIVEDMDYRNPTSLSNRINQLYLQIPYTRYSSPIRITNVCKQKNLNVCNIEFRWDQKDLLRRLPFTEQEYEQYLAAQKKVIDEIKSYNDNNEVLNTFYKSVVQKVEDPTWDPFMKTINDQHPAPFMRNSFPRENIGYLLYGAGICSAGMAVWLKHKNKDIPFNIMPAAALCTIPIGLYYLTSSDPIHNENNRALYRIHEKFTREMLLLQHESLIDARILHQIHISSDQDHIFVTVGGGHIEQIMPILEKLNYKQAGTAGNQQKCPVDLQNFFDFYHPVPELRKKNRNFQNPKTYSAPVCLPRVQ